MHYTNIRTSAIIDDYPYGSYRTRAEFSIEINKNGQRAVRITYHPTTQKKNAPKKTTYQVVTRIADGNDGKTYIVSYSSFGFINVMQSNMQFQQETIHSSDPRFMELKNALFANT